MNSSGKSSVKISGSEEDTVAVLSCIDMRGLNVRAARAVAY